MRDVEWVAMIVKTPRELPQYAGSLFHFAQQQPAAVRGLLTTVEPRHHLSPTNRLETELLDRTLCLHHAAAPVLLMLLLTLNLIARRDGVLRLRVRNAG
jgi:hypothetical protein